MVKPPHIKRSEKPPPPDSPEGHARLEKIKEFQRLLGKFVTIFSSLEVTLFHLLMRLSNTRREFGLALFADVRIDAAMSTGRRLLDAREEYLGASALHSLHVKWLNYAFDQLGILNGIRNQLIHHGLGQMSAGFDKGIITNQFRARSEKHLTEIPISAEIIEQMIFDTAIAGDIITNVITALDSEPVTAARILKSLDDLVTKYPWRYRSPLQAGKKGKNPGSSPK